MKKQENRRRPIQIKFHVSAEEKTLILAKKTVLRLSKPRGVFTASGNLRKNKSVRFHGN